MGVFGSFLGKQGVTAARSPDLSRRGFIVGAAVTLITAPAIVRAASLMPVKALPFGLSPLEYSFAQTKEIVASNILNLGQIRELLLPGLLEFRTSYGVLPNQWERIFAEVG